METSSSGGSEVSCSGFAVSTSNKSGGLLPVAISRGEYPLIVNCVFLAQTVIFTACRMVTPLNLSSPSNDMAMIVHCFLNNLTAVSALFGHGVLGPHGKSLIP